MTRAYDEAMAQSGMSVAQFGVLRAIEREGTLPLMGLAERLVMERTTLYRTLRPLEAQGWIKFESGPRRAKIVTMTQAGHAATAAAIPYWTVAQAALLDGFGEADWAVLRGLLSRVVTLTTEERV